MRATKMNVIVNDIALQIPTKSNLEQLLIILGKPLKGSALAVNQQIISRQHWAEHSLCEGDKISLFQAIAGG